MTLTKLENKLSKRETEIAALVAKGLTNKEIAFNLSISQRRVGEIVSNIKQKWSIESRVEIGIISYHLRLIDFSYFQLEKVD
ncbi:response regulator transcription factor [Rossellomorea aquimaris]|uniref:NarL family two-component system response regulator LiaR n=1 Tax=Rossellomorea aquimaris TaxID=189382 RepID=A0A366EM08_9BACI|nr:LuxR C-terminal-related transcriptional regulator [Rossellomorea aquimaris]RBP02485.1 NarL family two-component system response regulator LiaR [Rossellomorea aquimaris]